MPAKGWDESELKLAGAMGVNPTKPSNLSGPLLELFRRELWEVQNEEYELLLPSMRFASNLIRVGMPYIATFLPSELVFGRKPGEDSGLEGAIRGQPSQCPRHILLKARVKSRDLRAAENELNKIAKYMRWQLNSQMQKDLGWPGVTRLADLPKPWTDLTVTDISRSDAKNGGEPHRPLIIGIMEEYAKALRDSARNSEEHLRATFMAGITMAHEVGHVVFHQDFRSFDPLVNQDPYVGGDCIPELGLSFISWIFDGYNPDICNLGDEAALGTFKTPLHWRIQHTVSIRERPLYTTLYSISTKYIQRVLTQTFWHRLGSPEALVYSSKARGCLKPRLTSPGAKPAIVIEPEWFISLVTGLPTWKGVHFRLVGFSRSDQVRGLSNEDISAELEHKVQHQPVGAQWPLHSKVTDKRKQKSHIKDVGHTSKARVWRGRNKMARYTGLQSAEDLVKNTAPAPTIVKRVQRIGVIGASLNRIDQPRRRAGGFRRFELGGVISGLEMLNELEDFEDENPIREVLQSPDGTATPQEQEGVTYPPRGRSHMFHISSSL